MKKIIILILSMILMLSMVSAVTYYVNPDAGNDSNTGLDWANAWSHVGNHMQQDYGYTVISSGDEIVIKSGVVFNATYSIDSIIAWYTTRDNIVIRAESGGRAEAYFNSSMSKALFFGGDNNRVENIDFVTDTGLPFYTSYGSVNNVIENCTSTGFNAIANAGSPTSGEVIFNNFEVYKYNHIIYSGRNDVIVFNNLTLEEPFEYSSSTYPMILDQYNLSTDVNLTINNLTMKGHLNIMDDSFRNILCDDLYNVKLIDINGMDINNLGCSYDFDGEAMNFSIPNNSVTCRTGYDGVIEIIRGVDDIGAINLHNFNVGTAENPVHIEDTCVLDYNNLFYIVANLDNYNIGLHVYNNTFHFNDTEGFIHSRYQNNALFENNEIYNYCVDNVSKPAYGADTHGNNITVTNNNAYYSNTGSGHIFAIGTEGIMAAGKISDCEISNNNVYLYNNFNDLGRHSIFMGYCDGFLVENNEVHGAGYNYVIKGNDNGIVRNNLANHSISPGIRDGILHKSGVNVTYIDNVIYSSFFITTQNTEGDPTQAEYYNNKVYDNPISFFMHSSGAYNKDIKLYNHYPYNDSYIFVDASVENSVIDVHYSVDVIGNGDIVLELIDGQDNSEEYVVKNYDDIYHLSTRIVNNWTTVTDYSNYSYTASQYDQEESGTFVLNAPYILTLPIFSRVPQTCATISETVFNAMNLGVIGLIVLVASILVGATMAFGGASFDMNSMKAVIISVIIVSVLFMIGVMIIQMITGAVC